MYVLMELEEFYQKLQLVVKSLPKSRIFCIT